MLETYERLSLVGLVYQARTGYCPSNAKYRVEMWKDDESRCLVGLVLGGRRHFDGFSRPPFCWAVVPWTWL